MHWYNEPAVWAVNGGTITVTADHDTDFWRKTHYGFIRDNGHFYYQEVAGIFGARSRSAAAMPRSTIRPG